MQKAMQVFNDVVTGQRAADTRVGLRDPDGYMMNRRLVAFAAMTGGKGFRQYPAEPKKDAAGKTRGDKRAAARELYLKRAAASQSAAANGRAETLAAYRALKAVA